MIGEPPPCVGRVSIPDWFDAKNFIAGKAYYRTWEQQ